MAAVPEAGSEPAPQASGAGLQEPSGVPLALHDLPDLPSQPRILVTDDSPDDLVVGAEVMVDDLVSHSSNSTPLDLGVPVPQALWRFFAASPMISRLRTNARFTASSPESSSKVLRLPCQVAGFIQDVLQIVKRRERRTGVPAGCEDRCED